jgi:hypothetical protein
VCAKRDGKAAGITLALASRVEPGALLAAPVAMLIDWDAIRLPTGITAPRQAILD